MYIYRVSIKSKIPCWTVLECWIAIPFSEARPLGIYYISLFSIYIESMYILKNTILLAALFMHRSTLYPGLIVYIPDETNNRKTDRSDRVPQNARVRLARASLSFILFLFVPSRANHGKNHANNEIPPSSDVGRLSSVLTSITCVASSDNSI